jgi:hypothetical protein
MLIVIGGLFVPTLTRAQEEEKHEVKLLARPLADSIMLRWAPTTYRLWITGNQYGYHVTRTLVYENEQTIVGAKPVFLTKAPLKPVALPQWEKLADTQELAGVAAQAIYGEDFDVDAGAPPSGMVSIFNRASVQESRMSFALLAADLSVQVAHCSGLYFADNTALKGKKYLYRVFPAFVPEGMTVDTALFYTGVDEYMPLMAPANLRAKPTDRMVTLTWERLGQEGMFSGFFIERSDNNGVSFESLNASPLINTTPDGYDTAPFHFFIDSLANNQQQYLYRIRGISPFGELSPYSATVKVKGKDVIAVAPMIANIVSPDNKVVRVEWELSPEIASKVRGLTLQRSSKFDQGFETIVDSIAPVKGFVVDHHPMMTGYYRLLAYNNDGHGPAGTPRMIQLIDSIPPVPPTGIVAIADTTGKVTISWLPNPDVDIYGYRIFRANSSNEEFSQLTSKPIEDTVYVDQIDLRTLTKKVYYQVVAIDERQNRSEFSAIYEMERPDIVPPGTPAIRSIDAQDNGIALLWYPSSSSDVATQYIYRNSGDNPQWTLIAKLAPADTAYADTTVTELLYRYLLIATDKAGNESQPTKPVAVKYTKPVDEGGWITPEVKVNKKTGEVELRWEAKLMEGKRGLLYGKSETGMWKLIKPIDANSNYQIVSVNPLITSYIVKLF